MSASLTRIRAVKPRSFFHQVNVVGFLWFLLKPIADTVEISSLNMSGVSVCSTKRRRFGTLTVASLSE